jgi:membrane protease subunit (stomatin/prohibitin family)
MISITCPHCRTKICAEDRHAGRTVKCPECNSLVQVPSAQEQDMSWVSEVMVDDNSDSAPFQESAAPVPSLCDCPDCGKKVSRRARECPNCGCPIEVSHSDAKVGRASQNVVKAFEDPNALLVLVLQILVGVVGVIFLLAMLATSSEQAKLVLVVMMFQALVFGAVGWLIGTPRRAGRLGMFLGFLLGPIGAIATFAFDGRPRCPKCATSLNGTPQVCPNCRSALQFPRAKYMRQF